MFNALDVRSKEKVKTLTNEELHVLSEAIEEDTSKFPKAVINAVNQRLLKDGEQELSNKALRVCAECGKKTAPNHEFCPSCEDARAFIAYKQTDAYKERLRKYEEERLQREENRRKEENEWEQKILAEREKIRKAEEEFRKRQTVYFVKYDGKNFSVGSAIRMNLENEVGYILNGYYVAQFENRIDAENILYSYRPEISEGRFRIFRCPDCGKFFIRTKEEENWFLNKGLKEPVRCCPCRDKRRNEKNQNQ